MDNPWVLFAFLSIFHIVGAAVLVNALRELWRDLRERDVKGCRTVFLAVWGAMFGCLPFGFGIGLADAEAGIPLLLLGELLVWMGTFLVTLLAGRALKELLEPFLQQNTLLMLFGGGFFVSGVGVASLTAGDDGLGGLLSGGIVALVGSAIFGYGLWRLLRSTRQ